MWQRLSEEYDDTGLCVQAAHQRLDAIKRVDEFDYEGMVKLVDAVEGVHNMLKELNMLDAIHMSHVDDLGLKLPRSIHHDWTRRYCDLTKQSKMSPFPNFVEFLRRKRISAARMAESQVLKSRNRQETTR